MTKLGNQPSTPSEQNSISVISPVTHAKFTLSGAGSTNGPITLQSGSGTPTTIHQCDSNGVDEIYLWCFASGSVSTKVYVAIDNVLVLANDITSESGLVQLYPGVPHRGSIITAWANIAGSINMVGYVARHYPITDYNADLGFDATE